MIKLNDFKYNKYTQGGEDGIIEKIFSEIGIKKGIFCEFGASDGENYCNTKKLREEGWKGTLIEGESSYIERLKNNLKMYPNINIIESYVSCEKGNTLNEILDSIKMPKDFDFLSIDVDGNDYWIWKSLNKYIPKVVMVEYNSNYESSSILSIEYDKYHRHQLDAYYSATAGAYINLGKEKGYDLIGFTEGLNLVFCLNTFSSPFYKYSAEEIPITRVWPIVNGRELKPI